MAVCLQYPFLALELISAFLHLWRWLVTQAHLICSSLGCACYSGLNIQLAFHFNNFWATPEVEFNTPPTFFFFSQSFAYIRPAVYHCATSPDPLIPLNMFVQWILARTDLNYYVKDLIRARLSKLPDVHILAPPPPAPHHTCLCVPAGIVRK